MSKAKFDAARELINEHKYNEARAILKTIDHPKAKEWLDKLDRLQPPKLERRVWRSIIPLAVVLVVLVAVLIAVIVNNHRQSSLEASATLANGVGLVVTPDPAATETIAEFLKSAVPSTPLATSTLQSTATPDIATLIVGSWQRPDVVFGFTLYSDGTGVFEGFDMTYQVVGNKLTFYLNMGGTPAASTEVFQILSLTHDTLRLDTGTNTVIFHRQ